jgi:hypothetical protein
MDTGKDGGSFVCWNHVELRISSKLGRFCGSVWRIFLTRSFDALDKEIESGKLN